jgi:mitogen-activated protein kinase kinase kinase 9
VWELYTGHTAYGGLPVAEVIQRVALQDERPPVPEDMPEDYRLLMRSCWSSNPGDRPSFASVLRCIQLMLDTLIEGLPVEAFGGLEGSPLVADL